MANPDFTIDRVRTKDKKDKYSRSNWEDVDYQIECSEYKAGQIPKNYGAIQITSVPNVMKIHITPREGYKLDPSKVSNFYLATNVSWFIIIRFFLHSAFICLSWLKQLLLVV